MQVQPYLFFDGHCEEAIAFYRRAIGAEVVMLMRYGDGPAGSAQCPDGTQLPADKVMHACLQIGASQVLVSDGYSGGAPEFDGFSLALSADDDAAAKRMFDALADEGEVQQPLMATFFTSSFGMLVDRFGVSWMVMVPNTPAG
ncbi:MULTISPECIES: VOC family protein [Rhodanobacter]|uniref:VOC family protein n=1 Tax=Rhodanobacter TaxID=75309 RepID=UPI0003FDE8A6|nr:MULTISPECIES: VOC family protein [Rhodanobacter]TAN17118.1 MAG: VOC family protein [Rhodanobacter sp.]UJJ53757.1 VOC family protein [Rhodanobacter thiooxydans]